MRDGEFAENRLKEDEISKLRQILAIMESVKYSHDRYQVAEEALRGYFLLLHSRYGYTRIRSKGVNSLLIKSNREYTDLNTLYREVSKEIWDKVTYLKETQSQRLNIRWEDL